MDRLTYIGHATTLIRLEGTTVLTDPILRAGLGPLRRQGLPPPPALSKLPDAVLISHLHRDHLDIPSLRRVPSKTPLVVPRGASRLVEKAGRHPIVELGRGETISVGEAEVTAVPAEHGGRRGRWGSEIEPLGYVIRSEGRSVYFAGDTDLFEEMSEIGPVDVALLPVWGWGPSVGRGPPRPGDGGTSPDAGPAAAGRPDPLGNLLSRRRPAAATGAADRAAARVRPPGTAAGSRGRGAGSAARLRDVVGELMRGSHRIRRGIGRAVRGLLLWLLIALVFWAATGCCPASTCRASAPCWSPPR